MKVFVYYYLYTSSFFDKFLGIRQTLVSSLLLSPLISHMVSNPIIFADARKIFLFSSLITILIFYWRLFQWNHTFSDYSSNTIFFPLILLEQFFPLFQCLFEQHHASFRFIVPPTFPSLFRLLWPLFWLPFPLIFGTIPRLFQCHKMGLGSVWLKEGLGYL